MDIKDNLKTYGHVNVGWANRYYSDRVFNPNNMVCPPFHYRDTMGRPADRYSILSETAGCSSALERVQVEDSQRPTNFSSTTLSAIGLEGGYKCGQPEYMFQQQGYQTPDNKAYYNQEMRDNQWKDLYTKIRYYKHLSGCD